MKKTALTLGRDFKPDLRHLSLVIASALLLAVVPMAKATSSQIIGSFPEMTGGFEDEAAGNLALQSSIADGVQTTTWLAENTAANRSINTASPRSGAKYLNFGNSATTTKRFWSPTCANGAIVNTTAYTVQFYYKGTAVVSADQAGVSASGSSSPGTYVAFTTANVGTTWTKITVAVTSGTSAASPKYGTGILRTAANANFDVDDFCVYAGAVDTTAANPPTSLVLTPAPGQITVSWTAASGGVDGGGYVVLRRQSSDLTGDPNVNGIYAVGSSVQSGAVAYIGTGTSFVDTGRTDGQTYFYRVYTCDKAFNYSSALSGSAVAGVSCTTPSVPGSPLATAQCASVALSWSASTPNAATSYNIYRRVSAGSYGSALATGVTATTYNDATGTPGTTYFYKITGVSVTCESAIASSAEVSAAPLANPTTSAITGPSSFCLNQTGVGYSVTLTSGSSYIWVVPGGATITSGGTGPNNNAITVDFASTGGNITVTETNSSGCVGSTVTKAVTLTTAPAIAGQPSNVSVCDGANAVFTNLATGGSLTYQWQVTNTADGSFTNIPGATFVNYTNVGVTLADGGKQYQVIVSGACSPPATSSPPAVLTVNASATAYGMSGGGNYCSGGSGVSVGLTNSETGVNYLLRTNGIYAGVTLPGSTGVAIDFGLQTVAATYSVLGSNTTTACARQMLNTVGVVVDLPPAITVNLTNITACVGSSVIWSISATGAGLTYQWQATNTLDGSFTNIPTDGTFTKYTNVTTVAGDNGKSYRVIVSGTCTPPVTSSVSVLTLIGGPAIGTQPTNQTTTIGSTASFSVVATGPGLTYQWQSTNGAGGFTNISGATTSGYTTPATTTNDNGKTYQVVIGSSCGTSVTSAPPATLNVVGGFYRSQADGNWDTVATWEVSTNGTTGWHPADVRPNNTNSDSIIVTNARIVTVAASVSADDLTVNGGGKIIISAGTFTIANGTAAIDCDVAGTIEQTGGTFAQTGALNFGSGGYYKWNQATAVTIPTATWNINSTCEVANSGGTSPTTVTGMAGQSFGSFNWSSAATTATVDFVLGGGATTTIKSNFTVHTSGAGKIFLHTASTSGGTVNVGGNMLVTGTTSTGKVLLAGNQDALTMTFYVTNNFTVDATGNLDVGAGAGTSARSIVHFSGTGAQSLTLAVALITANREEWHVDSGASLTLASGLTATTGSAITNNGTLDLGTQVISGSGGVFTHNSGATLKTAHASGLNGNLTLTGTKTMSTAANYTYNGVAAQVTGALEPATVNNMTVDNAAGVTLSQSVTVSGTLAMTSGFLVDNSPTLSANVLSGTGTITNGTVTARTVTVGAGGGSSSFGGAIRGNLALTKSGAGTLTLTAANDFTTNTAISTGTLALSGSATISGTPVIDVSGGAFLDVSGLSSTFTLGSGQKLQGTGAVVGNAATAASALLSPAGSSAGTLTFSNNLTLNATSTNYFDLTNSPGTSDLVNVTSQLTPNSSVVAVTIPGTSLKRGSYRLFNYGTKSGSFNPGAVLLSGTTVGPYAISEATSGQVNFVVSNAAPTVGSDTYTRGNDISMKIKISDLLTNDSDVDGDTVLFVGHDATTTNGQSIFHNGTFIFVPTNNVADRFSYSIHDGNGATNSGFVFINTAFTFGQLTTVSNLTTNATVIFFGVPGITYYPQRDTNLDFNGAGLRSFPGIEAPVNGAFQLDDDFSDIGSTNASGTAYYRLIVP